MRNKTIFNIAICVIGLLTASEILWSSPARKAPTPGYIKQGAKVTGQKYRFHPNRLSFQAGKPITIVFTSIDGSHSFAIDRSNYEVKRLAREDPWWWSSRLLSLANTNFTVPTAITRERG